MGQAAGVKRNKAKYGNYNILKARKSEYKKSRILHRSGIEFLGMKEDNGKECLMSRIEKAGLVANLKTFNKPGRDTTMVGPGIKKLEKLKNPSHKYTQNEKTDTEVVKTVLSKRDAAKARKFAKRNVGVPKPQAKRIAYFLDKYGEDYKAMVSDPMNYDQFTLRQLKTQVESFKSTTSQYARFLADRGLISNKDDIQKTKTIKTKQIKEVEPEEEDSNLSDDDSDGENGQNFMAKVRAMEGRDCGDGDNTSNEEDNTSDDNDESTDNNESADTADHMCQQAQVQATSSKACGESGKRRERAKNFKVAKLKRLQKTKRKFGIK